MTLQLGTSELGLGTGRPSRRRRSRCASTPTTATRRSELRAAGTQVLEEPADQPWGERMARVTDPAGNEIVIVARLYA